MQEFRRVVIERIWRKHYHGRHTLFSLLKTIGELRSASGER
jgi:hypothetical protein